MDKTILVDEQFEEGKKLIEALDKEGYRYPIALWMNSPENNDWILFIGVPNLKKSGSRDIFKKIQDIIKKNNIHISLNDISLLDTSDNNSQALRTMIKTGYAIGKINFIGNFINGQKFPDSIIYRVN